MKKYLFVFVFTCICACNCHGQTFPFQKAYRVSTGRAFGRSILPFADKSYLLTGYASDSVTNFVNTILIKVDSLGDVIWSNTYAVPSSNIAGTKTIMLNDSSLIVIANFSATSISSFGIMKCDSHGNLIWSKSFSSLGGSYAFLADGGVLSDGKLIFCGGASGTVSEAFLICTDTSGIPLWGKSIGTGNGEMYTGLISLPSGGFVVTCNGWSHQSYLDKFDNSGNLLWHQSYTFPGNISYDVETDCIDSTYDGGFVIGGEHSPTGTQFPPRPYILKTDSSGNVDWCNVYRLPIGIIAEANIYGIHQTFDRGIVMTMENELPLFNVGFYQFGLFKTDSAGNLLWNELYDTTKFKFACQVTEDYDSNLIVTGYCATGSPYGIAQSGIYFFKADPNGQSGCGTDSVLPIYTEPVSLTSGGVWNQSSGYVSSSISVNQSITDLTIFENCTVVNSGFIAGANQICPGTCTDFLNLSFNATSFQWSFSGGTPPTSTDENPQSVCYSTPGNYDVQLIASNSNGSDTLTLNNYITVLPQPAPQSITQNEDTLFAIYGATSYQWYYNGNFISGATNYFYVAPQSGDYNVVATDANACEVEAAIFNVLAAIPPPMVGKSSQFKLYPNPASDKLEIVLPSDININDAGGINISVLNVLGEDLTSVVGRSDAGKKNSSAEIILDVRMLTSGMYWIVVNDNKNIFRSRIIKN